MALCGLALAQEKPVPEVLDIVGLGKAQGDYGTSRGGRQFERYRGIPFGKSPGATGRRFLVFHIFDCIYLFSYLVSVSICEIDENLLKEISKRALKPNSMHFGNIYACAFTPIKYQR
jgi:hypothetical protein